jgi:hypothetical protein
MANTYDLITSTTVGAGGVSAITFSSIPATYTDLIVKLSGRSTSSGGDCSVTFNGNNTSYSSRVMYGDGSAVSSSSTASAASATWGAGAINRSTTTSNTFANTDIYIPNYANSSSKPLSTDSAEENNGSQAYQMIVTSLWGNSSAITSITLTPSSSGNFVQYSTATLYGIKKN